MSNILDELEIDGGRIDFEEALGQFTNGDSETIAAAGTLVMVRRLLSRGPLNEDTLKYDQPTIQTQYTGPAHISPVTFRRDRQEIAGEEAVRIRQSRMIIPWDSGTESDQPGNIHIGDFVVVIMSADPDMEGRTFDITDVMYESELLVRRLGLTDVSKDFDPLC
jgi:hypothetical protein